MVSLVIGPMTSPFSLVLFLLFKVSSLYAANLCCCVQCPVSWRGEARVGEILATNLATNTSSRTPAVTRTKNNTITKYISLQISTTSSTVFTWFGALWVFNNDELWTSKCAVSHWHCHVSRGSWIIDVTFSLNFSQEWWLVSELRADGGGALILITSPRQDGEEKTFQILSIPESCYTFYEFYSKTFWIE